MPNSVEVEQLLTGPGGAFEVTTDTVNGVEMKVFKDRMRSLRDIFPMAAMRGDGEGATHIVYGDRRIGFAEFVRGVNRVSSALATRHGIGRGDRVAVLSANNPEWVYTFWATVNLGAILVGLNGWWKADEIVYGIEDSGAKVLVADRGRYDRVADQIDALGLDGVYIVEDNFAELLDGPSGAGGAQETEAELPDAAIEEDDPAVIFYTSGTTGRPKGAISTHRSMIANLQNTMYNAIAGAMRNPDLAAAAAGAPAGGQTASLATSPFFHVSGCHSGIVVGLLAGVKIVIPQGKFEPEKAMSLIQAEKISVWATVPTMVWRVVEHPDRHNYDLSSIATVAYGGSPSAAELQRRVQETFGAVKTLGNAYGLTESSSVATAISGDEFLARPDSVGRPMPVVELRIVRDDGTDAPTGDLGEVWIKGPIIMPGYWNKPEATAESVTDGWLHSGDVGYIDEEGFLYITDRAKDMIIRGGENVYCVEIENRLAEHPAIAEAAVIGVPHQSLGEEVKAVVRVEPGMSITEAEVRDWVAATLANFKVPTYVDIVKETLPRNASGKLLKNVLRGEGEVSFAETM
jgi:long-chain acyl-CoA synthetase